MTPEDAEFFARNPKQRIFRELRHLVPNISDGDAAVIGTDGILVASSIWKRMTANLGPLELKIFDGLFEGKTREKMAEELGKPLRVIERLERRIDHKVKRGMRAT